MMIRAKILLRTLLITFVVCACLFNVAAAETYHGFPISYSVLADATKDGGIPSVDPVELKAGQYIKFELINYGGTGYEWKLLNDPLKLVIPVYTEGPSPINPSPGLMGGPTKLVQIFRVKDGASGEETFRYRLRRVWEKDSDIKKLNIKIIAN